MLSTIRIRYVHFSIADGFNIQFMHVKNCPIDIKLGMMISATVRYIVERVETL